MDILLKRKIDSLKSGFYYQPKYEKVRDLGHNYSMYYCSECKSFHEFYTKDNYIDYKYGFTNDSIYCKATGHAITREEKTKLIEINRDYAFYNRDYAKNYIVFFDKNKKGQTLLKITIFGELYTAWNDKLQVNKTAKELIFNLDTGMSYYRSPYFLKSKKPINNDAKQYVNFSLDVKGYLVDAIALNNILKEDLVQIGQYMVEYKQSVLGYRPKLKRSSSILDLALFNRMPSCDIDTYAKVRRLDDIDITVKRTSFHRKVASIKSDQDLIEQARALLKVKSNKTYNKFISSTDIYTAHIIVEHFKDINNIAKLVGIKLPIEFGPFLDFMIEQFGEVVTANKIKKLYDQYVKEYDDESFYFCMSASSAFCDYLQDIANMYDMITKRNVAIELNTGMNLKEIHDFLSLTYSKCKRENVELKYKESEIKRFSFKNSQFNLRFAKDTHELIEVGNKMGICVGSYGNIAISRQSDILVVQDTKTNEYVCCIERSGNTCKQIKAKRNNMVQGDLLDFIEAWLEYANLSGGNDFNQAKNSNSNNEIALDNPFNVIAPMPARDVIPLQLHVI